MVYLKLIVGAGKFLAPSSSQSLKKKKLCLTIWPNLEDWIVLRSVLYPLLY